MIDLINDSSHQRSASFQANFLFATLEVKLNQLKSKLDPWLDPIFHMSDLRFKPNYDVRELN